jgi:hypothetical protein
MRKAKQSTAKNVMVLMVGAADHITGLAGLTLTITLSKDGAAFAGIAPTVTDRSNGWYNVALTASHTDTLGDLALHITGAAADPVDMVLLVEAGATDADVSTRLATAGYTAPDNATITLIAGYTDELETRLTAGRAALLDNLSNLDALVSSRLATAGYTAPDNANIVLAMKILRNKTITDPATGVMTVYDDDDTTPLLTANLHQDAAQTTLYDGNGAEARGRLQ